MIAYISGKITGDPDYRKKFANAASVLLSMGHTVLSPTDLPPGLDYEEYMRIDVKLIGMSDMVVMLPDWYRSNGAKRERKHAIETGKDVRYYETMVQEWLKESERTTEGGRI